MNKNNNGIKFRKYEANYNLLTIEIVEFQPCWVTMSVFSTRYIYDSSSPHFVMQLQHLSCGCQFFLSQYIILFSRVVRLYIYIPTLHTRNKPFSCMQSFSP